MRIRKVIRDFPPINLSLKRRVRFEEVDAVSFMWHGRYASWLEDGREAMGEAYGISYETFHAQNVIIPLKTFSLDFLSPLRYNVEYTVETSLLWNEAALLEYDYKIFDCDNKIMTKASTIQLMTTLQGEILLETPDFYQSFCKRWKQNEL